MSKLLANGLVLFCSLYPVFIILDQSIYYYVVMIFLAVLVAMKTRGVPSSTTVISLYPLIIFSAICIASIMWSMDPAVTSRKSVAFACMVFVTLVIVSLIRKHPEYLYRLTLSFSIVSSVSLIFFYFTYGTVRHLYEFRLPVEVSVANENSAYLVVCIPLLLYGAVRSRENMVRLSLYSMGLILSVVGVLISQSRAGYLLSAVAIAGFLLLYQPRKFERKVYILKMLFIVLILSSVAMIVSNPLYTTNDIVSPVIGRIENSRFIDPHGSVDGLRINMLLSIPRILESHPFTGIGFEAYSRYSAMVYGIREFSHNLFLSASEVGVLGVAMWVSLLFTSVYRTYKSFVRGSREERNRISVISVALVIGFVHSMFRPQLQNMMFLVVLSVSLTRWDRQSGRFKGSPISRRIQG